MTTTKERVARKLRGDKLDALLTVADRWVNKGDSHMQVVAGTLFAMLDNPNIDPDRDPQGAIEWLEDNLDWHLRETLRVEKLPGDPEPRDIPYLVAHLFNEADREFG